VRRLGDNHGWKEGETLIGVTFLMKATSLKWELVKLIRSGRLSSKNKRSEHKR